MRSSPSLAVDPALTHAIHTLAPFGIGNSKPVFITRTTVQDIRPLGKEGAHLKVSFTDAVSDKSGGTLSGVLFSKAKEYTWLTTGTICDVVYTLDWNEWQGRSSVQAKIIQMTAIDTV